MIDQLDQRALITEEAEQGLLGALMLRPEAWNSIVGKVSSEDFYNPVHGRIFEKIEAMVDAGKRADAITMRPFFESDPDLEAVGRSQYLAALVGNVVSVQNARHYADTIRAMAMRRRFILTAAEAMKRAADPNDDFLPLLADVTAQFERLSMGETKTVRQSVVFESVLEDLLRTGHVDPTGIHALDERGMRGGLYRGFTYGIAAKAKAGKTTLAHSISYNLNMAGIRHAYIALEMGKKQIVQRQLARHGGFNSLKFLEDRSSEFATQVTTVGMSLPDNCLYIDAPNMTFSELRSSLAQMVLREKIHGFFLDYWQLVTGREKGQTQEEHQATVAQWIAAFCRKHNIWCVLIAQLNKEDNAFGGAGINRACDQFYKLYRSDIVGCESHAWLDLEHSRYTYAGEIGNENCPSLKHVTRSGPYIEDFR